MTRPASLSSAAAASMSAGDVLARLHDIFASLAHSGGGHGGSGSRGDAGGSSSSSRDVESAQQLSSDGWRGYTGLPSSSARLLLSLYGPNELASEESAPVWRAFLDKLREPMIALLLASAGVSLLTGQMDDAISIAAAVIIVVTVALVQEYKSDESLAALSKLAPHTCNAMRDGSVLQLPAAAIVPGDLILIGVGDRIPADLRILDSVDLSVDESSLTGENEPSEKSAAAVQAAGEVPVAERRCILFMGTLVRTGRARGVAVATGAQTELGHVCELMDKEEEKKSPLQERMDELGKLLSFISFGIIGVIVVIGLLWHKHVLEMFTVGVSLAVAAIPEGLPIVVTVTLALGVQRMAAQKAVVKKLPAVESLGCASVICVDKTGTLTRNEMTAVEAFTLVSPHAEDVLHAGAQALPAAASGIHAGMTPAAAHQALHEQLGRSIGSRFLFTGLGYDARGGGMKYASLDGDHAITPRSAARIGACTVTASTHAHVGLLLEAAAVCNNAHITLEQDGVHGTVAKMAGQPTEGALLAAAAKCGMTDIREQYTRTGEISFTSETKWMAVRAASRESAAARAHELAINTGAATVALTHACAPSEAFFVKGSVDAVLGLCDFVVCPPGSPGALSHSACTALLGEQIARQTSLVDFSLTPLSVVQHAAILAAAETMAREGLRVLALAKGDRIPSAARYSGTSHVRPLPTSGSPRGADVHRTMANSGATSSGGSVGGLVFLGLVGLHDPPREGVVETIRTLRRGGVRVCMITGDSEATALAIGAHLGLVDERGVSTPDDASPSDSGGMTPMTPALGATAPHAGERGAEHEVDTEALAVSGAAISGAEVDALSEEALAQRVRTVSVFYRTTPRHKMKIVHAFQRNKCVVAMTGDGVNDAPALKVADIGVAMGRSGTDVAKEAADMVLVDDNFSTILVAIEEGKGIFANIRNFVRFQLSTSVAALTLVAASTLCGLPNPLNAMQILWINIIMDGPPAQSLGVETVDPDIMKRPPRRSDEPIITRDLLVRIFTSAAIIVLGTLFVFYSEMAHDFTATRRDTTMTFTTFVMFDMFNAFSCRSSDRSVFSLGLTSNRFFLIAVSACLCAQVAVVYVPALQAIFQTEALSFGDWLYILAITSTVLWVDELRKLISRPQARAGVPHRRGGCAAAISSALGRKRLRYGYSMLTGDAAGAAKRSESGGAR